MLAAASFAQKPPEPSENAPAEVDAALRTRVNQFFQFEVGGKFHLAEQLVVEDQKDYFVASSKPTYASFEIKDIKYSDNFTKAIVLVTVSRMVAAEGFLGQKIPSVVPSRWKLENGQWCWYRDPADLRASPFGALPPPPGMPPPGMPPSLGSVPAPGVPAPGVPAPGAAATTASSGPSRPPAIPSVVTSLGVKADKPAVVLKAGVPSSDQVTIVNPQPRALTVSLVKANTPGLSVKLDRPDLRPGGKVVVSIESSGKQEPPGQPVTISVRVQQTNQVIPIKVSFEPPAK